ncbi:MAG: hypothetical protein ACLP3R_22455 [Candidatus Korobacteraceae bacterium]
MAIAILLVHQRYCLYLLLAATLLIPLQQQVVVAGVHLTVFRLLLPLPWFRLSGTFGRKARFHILDGLFLAWVAAKIVTFLLLYPDSLALVNRLGFIYNTCGTYFLVRLALRDKEDLDRLVQFFGYAVMVLATVMAIEHFTAKNLFSIFGGVQAITVIRDGRLRCFGPFANPIIAGTFGAAMMPLLIGLWQLRKSCTVALCGMISCVVIVYTSASSTPVLALAIGIAAYLCWPFRDWLGYLRWATVAMLGCAQLFIHNPIWHLLVRVNVVGGSSGWQRYLLVDTFIRHFPDWWLIGTTSNWTWGEHMFDTANTYVEMGVEGGLVTLTIFLALSAYSFKSLGLIGRKAAADNDAVRSWSYGVSLCVHMAAFMGITYFDQMSIVWYAFLAMVAALAAISPGYSRQMSPISVPTGGPLRLPAALQPLYRGNHSPRQR